MNNKLCRKLARQQFRRMLTATVLLLFSGVLIYICASLIFGMFDWSGTETLYRLAVWAQMRRFWFGLFYYGIGGYIVFHHYWFKPYHYIEAMIEAAEVVTRQDDALVELPSQLSEVEGKLNQIKVTSLNNLRAAKEAEQRKNDLVTYLAHDLKTPITSVIGYLTLLRDEPDISPEMRQRYMNITLDKAERLDDLINEFFEITRFNLSHISLDKRLINLSLMLQQLLYEFKPMLAEKNLTCTLSAADNIMLRCDSDKLQRVFDNLLRNAVNYSFENSRILISAAVEKDSVSPFLHIVFENQGDTISEEKLGRLFEQFYRLDTSRSSRSGGAGLGLAIAKEIIELHGGAISASSQNDTIRFDIRLPM